MQEGNGKEEIPNLRHNLKPSDNAALFLDCHIYMSTVSVPQQTLFPDVTI